LAITKINGKGKIKMNEIDCDLAKLRSEALDKRHIKLAIWGVKEQLISVLRRNEKDPFSTDQKWINLNWDKEYPKIETLYNRDGKYVNIGALRKSEFAIIKRWSVTEKLNGQNSRITLFYNGEVQYGGKTDKAELRPEVIDNLKKIFPPELLQRILWIPDKKRPKSATIYGESYGPKTSAGSGIYRKDIGFRLFDCLIEGIDGSWWLERINIEDIANKLGIRCVPIIGYIDYLPSTVQQLIDILGESVVAREEGGIKVIPEGIVARSEPLIYDKKGDRIIWKLKIKDFKQ
jgi:hypothetical protein